MSKRSGYLLPSIYLFCIRGNKISHVMDHLEERPKPNLSPSIYSAPFQNSAKHQNVDGFEEGLNEEIPSNRR